MGSSVVRCCICIWFQRVLHHNLVLQRDFTQPTELSDSSLPVRDIRRLVAPLPVADQVQRHLGIKFPLGQDPKQQHLHLGQGQARRFFLI
jgi:hypothetical protein